MQQGGSSLAFMFGKRSVTLDAAAGAHAEVSSTVADAAAAERLRLLWEEARWKNKVVVGWFLSEDVREGRNHLPLWIVTWMRNYIAGLGMYFGICSLWCLVVYGVYGSKFYKPGEIPTFEAIKLQMWVSLQAMPFYTLLPTATEHCVLNGWTRAYPRISDVGYFAYAAQFVLYMTCVEFGVYWMHRSLHEIKWGYKHLHAVHHVYNKESTLSPFAGLAFHPLDGILQALPYSLSLLIVPFHFLTHEFLLFATSVWTTNIHDCLHGRLEPIMGAGYHTIHHTDYKTNYGHYFVYMDYLFGTLLPPDEYNQRQKKVKAT